MSDLSKETSDFGVGVFARLKAPEELQNQFIPIHDGSVGLFRGADTRGYDAGRLFPAAKSLRGASLDSAGAWRGHAGIR